jgi:tyrosyl-tRNA synthetase
MDFIRTYGVHFNVNRMLDAECFKMRMEKGLTFFELNYMLMQSYDFLKLFETENCRVQIGGDDQWSNMLAGVDLIRKIHKSGSFCVTCPLLLNSDGTKMGKTVKGALWLDPEKTTPYEFYQYWRNIEDASVNQVLRSLTYLPMEEVNRLSSLKDEHINEAKKIAAFEITKLIHGEEEALKAKQTAEELFENRQNADNMPTVELAKDSFVDGTIGLLDVMVVANVAKSKGEGKTLIAGGGISLDDEKVTDVFKKLNLADFEKGYVVLKKGKKVFIKLVIK